MRLVSSNISSKEVNNLARELYLKGKMGDITELFKKHGYKWETSMTYGKFIFVLPKKDLIKFYIDLIKIQHKND